MLPFLAATCAKQGGVVLAHQAVAAGLTREEIRRLVQTGAWTRIRRSAYVETASWAAADAITRHRLLVRATILLGAGSAVVCDRSAVAWHGLDTLTAPPSQVHVRVPVASGGRSSRLVIRHGGELAAPLLDRDGDVTIVSAPVAAVEMACAVPFREGVVVCDSALRAGATPQALLTALAAVTGRPGASRARRAVAFADGRSGSAGESLSRVLLHELGLDPEDLQTAIRDDRGLIGFTDFSWLSHHTVGEFDGRVKYGRDAPGGDARDVLWREKLREDRLRARVLEIVRWTWADLDRPDEIDRRIRSAWARAAHRFPAA